jgi:hypothetical protein
VPKSFENFDFTLSPGLDKQRMLELRVRHYAAPLGGQDQGREQNPATMPLIRGSDCSSFLSSMSLQEQNDVQDLNRADGRP